MKAKDDFESLIFMMLTIKEVNEPEFTISLEQFILKNGVAAFKAISEAIQDELYPINIMSNIVIKIGQMKDSDEYLRLIFLIECLHCSYAYIRNAATIALSHMGPHPKIQKNLKLALYKEKSVLVKENIQKVYDNFELWSEKTYGDQFKSRRKAHT